MISQLIVYRRYFIILSQFLSCSFCIYYISQVQHYELSWKLLSFILPSSILNLLNSGLQMTGTFILIIPLTLVIAAFLFPENILLQITSTAFGVGSTLCMLLSGAYNGTIGEVYNMRIITVKKILTFQEKVAIFKQECFTIIEETYKTKQDLYSYLHEHLLENSFEIYYDKLRLLEGTFGIKNYAKEIVNNFVHNFLQRKQDHLYDYATGYVTILKYLAYLGIGLASIALIATIVRLIFQSDKMVEGATLARETANLSAKNTDSVINTQEIVERVLELIKEDIPGITQSIISQTTSNLKSLLAATDSALNQKCNSRFEALESAVGILTKGVAELTEKKQNTE